ncbi:putative 54S ribosomal protein L17, mitochondrial [Xylogone sp. PMI_703]|nr:putative 54S ribosomal protein L17, mitochondrial [Xylogone sp. PMI_703]
MSFLQKIPRTDHSYCYFVGSTRHQRLCSECVKTISRTAPIPQRSYATAATTNASSTASSTSNSTPPPLSSSSQLNISTTPPCTSNTPEYSVKAAVVLSRPPLITAPQTPFESAFFFYQKRLNERLAMPFTRYFYFKKDTPADNDWKIKVAERNGAAARELGGYQAYGKMGWNDEVLVGDERSKPGYVIEKLLEESRVRAAEGKDGAVNVVGQDASADEAGGVERVESRWTEADRKRDVKRLDRKLAETLYLVVQNAKGGWGFPTGDLIGRENLHLAAERILVQAAGVNMNTWLVGHAPIGHHIIKPYINPETKSIEKVGDKVFFMKGRIMAGQADLKGNLFGLTDFKWLTKRELEKCVSPKYYSSIRNMLADR